jgi:hypothetical protein
MDGRVKPDLVAPGGIIIGAKSRDMGGSSIDPGPLERPGRGTSMATPHVTGVAALILQLSPNITSEDLAEVIRRTARQDNFTGPIGLKGSNLWGWGKLNAVIAYPLSVRLAGYKQGNLSLSINGTPVSLSSVRAVVLLPTNMVSELRPAFTGDNGSVRHIVEPEVFYASYPGEAVFTISTQYYVRVYGVNNELLYSDWAPAGTILDLEELSGLRAGQGFQLARRSVVGYYTDGSGFLERRVSVERPMNIYIMTAEDYTYVFLVTVISVAVSASIYLGWVYAKYRRKAGD